MTVTQNSREIHHVFERATWIRIALKSFYKKRDTLLIVCIALKHHPRNCIKKNPQRSDHLWWNILPRDGIFSAEPSLPAFKLAPNLAKLISEGSILCRKWEQKKARTTCQNLPFHLPARTFYPSTPRSHTWAFLGSHTQHQGLPHSHSWAQITAETRLKWHRALTHTDTLHCCSSHTVTTQSLTVCHSWSWRGPSSHKPRNKTC